MKGIVLFDDTCGLCSGAVSFILKRDRAGQFHFAPLQGDFARRQIEKYRIKPDGDFLVLIEGEKAYTASTAALRIAQRLPYPWRLAGLMLFLPKGLRDWAYGQIASRRKKWFGSGKCALMERREFQDRFLTEPGEGNENIRFSKETKNRR
jgi:predicted DCC family thiol-disulfide oxidoreductase YuxK